MYKNKWIDEKKFKVAIDKKHTSIVIINLQLHDEQIIKLHAYDAIADYVYQNISKGAYIAVEGKIRDNFVEINNIFPLILQVKSARILTLEKIKTNKKAKYVKDKIFKEN